MMRLTIALKLLIQSSVDNFYLTANMHETPDLSGDGCLHVVTPAKISFRRAPLFTSVLSSFHVRGTTVKAQDHLHYCNACEMWVCNKNHNLAYRQPQKISRSIYRFTVFISPKHCILQTRKNTLRLHRHKTRVLTAEGMKEPLKSWVFYFQGINTRNIIFYKFDFSPYWISTISHFCPKRSSEDPSECFLVEKYKPNKEHKWLNSF